jgi:hypothetical protein
MKPLYSGMIINKVGEWNNEIWEHVEVNSLVKCSLDSEYNTDEFPLPDYIFILYLRVREGAFSFAFESLFAFGAVSCKRDISNIADSVEGFVSGRCPGVVVDVVNGFKCDEVHYKVNEVGLSRHEKHCD